VVVIVTTTDRETEAQKGSMWSSSQTSETARLSSQAFSSLSLYWIPQPTGGASSLRSRVGGLGPDTC